MITLMIIGILFFTWKMTAFALKAAWGLTKGIFAVVILPIVAVTFLVCGLVSLAVPLLVIGIIVVLIGSAVKQLKYRKGDES